MSSKNSSNPALERIVALIKKGCSKRLAASITVAEQLDKGKAALKQVEKLDGKALKGSEDDNLKS